MQRNDLAIVPRKRTIRGALAVVLAGVVAGALVIALGGGGPASAASRGFFLENKSDLTLKLYAIQEVPRFTCVDPGRCNQTFYDLYFEGRPGVGGVVKPNGRHRFELAYSFEISGGVQFAATLWYKIQGDNDPDDNVYYTIETYSTSNESYCKINHTSKYECTAAGTQLTFKSR